MPPLSPPKQCRTPIQYGAKRGTNGCASGDRGSRCHSLSAHESGLMDWCKNIIDSIFIRYVRTWATEVSIKGRDSALGTDIPSSPLLLSSPRLSAASRPPRRAARLSRLQRVPHLFDSVRTLAPSLRTARPSAQR